MRHSCNAALMACENQRQEVCDMFVFVWNVSSVFLTGFNNRKTCSCSSVVKFLHRIIDNKLFCIYFKRYYTPSR